MPRELRARPWTCTACAEIIGTVDGEARTLHVTMRGAFVEYAGPDVYVHCDCGAFKRFSGQRVVVRPAATDTRKAS